MKRIDTNRKVSKAKINAAIKAGNFEEALEELTKAVMFNGVFDSSMSSPSAVYEATIDYRFKRQEHFVVLTLNNKNMIISKCLISIGTVSETIVHPREIFRQAVVDNASSIVLVHNHPSGNTAPSREDIEVTSRIEKAGALLGIRLLDHVIISKLSYLSMREDGYIGRE